MSEKTNKTPNTTPKHEQSGKSRVELLRYADNGWALKYSEPGQVVNIGWEDTKASHYLGVPPGQLTAQTILRSMGISYKVYGDVPPGRKPGSGGYSHEAPLWRAVSEPYTNDTGKVTRTRYYFYGDTMLVAANGKRTIHELGDGTPDTVTIGEQIDLGASDRGGRKLTRPIESIMLHVQDKNAVQFEEEFDITSVRDVAVDDPLFAARQMFVDHALQQG